MPPTISPLRHPPNQFAVGALFLFALGFTTWIYWPGLNGLFLLDDAPNLQFLSAIHDGESLHQTLVFALQGIAGTLGRPISLLTFGFQAHSWPSDPWSFKYVNLMIHLLNGCLLFLVAQKLVSRVRLSEVKQQQLALIVSAAWLLHPLQISSVLYVVQRMNELSALFTLAGLYFYLKGRLEGRGNYYWMSLGIGLGGILATLSKENGVLIALFTLVIEFTLLRGVPRPRRWHWWAGLFVYAPLAFLALYLTFGGVTAGYANRDFTLAQRLLTEAHVVVDYLIKLFVPRMRTYGLFYDDFPIARSWLNPPSTLLWVGAAATLFASAFYARKRATVFSFGILWFFAGHVLESTVIPLELYFEHRNYIPIIGPLLAASYYLFRLMEAIPKPALRRLAFGAMALWAGLFVFITWEETGLWGDSIRQAVLWAREKPHSRRAQAQAASAAMLRGRYHLAAEYYQRIPKFDHNDPAPYLLWYRLGCYDETLSLPKTSTITDNIAKARPSNEVQRTVIWAINDVILQRSRGECDRLNGDTLRPILDALISSPSFRRLRYQSYHLLALFSAEEGQYTQAVSAAGLSLRDKADIRVVLEQVAWAVSAHRADDAARYLERARVLARTNSIKGRLYMHDIQRWQGIIQKLGRDS